MVISAASGNIWALFASLFVYGAGTSTNLQARYAGTDLAAPAQRATAVSVAMVATTLGAVLGPNLVVPLGGLALQLGLPRHSGPFLLAAVAFLSAGVVLLVLLRPDPFLVAKQIAGATDAPVVAASAAGGPVTGVGAGAYVGAAVMVCSQISMVAIMTMTPVHMGHHGHGYEHVGLVIGLHIGAMYLPSLVTGRMVDRFGRVLMAVLGGLVLLASGVVAAMSPGDSLPLLITALVLLGVGWNFTLIAGTALVVDATTPATRPKTQGTIDVAISLAGAAGGGVSGLIMAGASFPTLSVIGGVAGLLAVPVVLRAQWRGRLQDVRED